MDGNLQRPNRGFNEMCFVFMPVLGVPWLMRMSMRVCLATEKPCAHDIHEQAQECDRYSLIEVNTNRFDQAGNGLIANEQGDHRQDDGAGEPR